MSGSADDSANSVVKVTEPVFPVSAALACRVVEEYRSGDALTFISDAASDTDSVEALAFDMGLRAFFRRVDTAYLERCLVRLHESELGQRGINIATILNEESAPYFAELRQHYVESVVARAVAEGASDIHLQPSADALVIRLRVDGRLRVDERLPQRMAAPLVAQVKVLARLSLAERRLPQDGRFSVEANGVRTDLRVSILPSIHGESAVLRIEDDVAPTSIAGLGLPEALRESLETLLRRKGGLILVGGPTGSGKTTTLYAMMRFLNDSGSKLLSVEDPVERLLPGVNQVPVETGGMGFGSAIRAMLRHSPDAIMVGEIRDAETAAAACEAALTGHLVLASAHARDAVEVALRVADLGVSRQTLACVLEAALTQRLVRRLCPECAKPTRPNPPLARALGLQEADLSGCRAPVGCPACAGTGYRGRSAIFALVTRTEALHKAIADGAGAPTLRKLAAECGMPTLTDAARHLAASGLTSPEEALLCANADEPTL